MPTLIDTLITWLGGNAKTVAFAILSGVTAFIAKSIYDLRVARRKDRLDRINQQLKLLYGPLYALYQAGNIAWDNFCTKMGRDKNHFFATPTPTAQDLEAWRLWIRVVFQPLNEQLAAVITANADLLVEPELPPALQECYAHVAAYRVVIARWDAGDYSEHTSTLDFPTEALRAYIEESFRQLKDEQAALL